MQWLYWIIAIIISAAAGYWVYRADKKREVPYPWLTALLRTLVIFLVLLLILVPFITITRNETQKPVILFLQDNSTSIPRALGKDSASYRKNAEQLMEKLSANYRVIRWGFGNTVQTDSIFRYKQQSTNISSALARAQEFYGTQNLGAIVLATDGRFNEGTNPQFQQLALRSPLYTVGIGDTAVQKDLKVMQVFANKTASLNSQFEIRADIAGVLCRGYNNSAQLTEAGNTIATSLISINSDRYDRSISFTLKANKPGLHHYIVSLPVAEGETNTANNRRDVFIEVVDEKKNILIVTAAPHPDINAIKDAMEGMESYRLTVKSASEVPSLSNYQVIILHQVPNVNDNFFRELQSSNKPSWYILGSQSNMNLLTPLQKPVALNINTMVMRDVLPAYNSSFNLFTLPQTLQAVVDKMPPLSVPAGSIQAMPDASVLFNQRNSNEQIPLWVLQQGAQPMAFVAGEGIWRWRLYEYRFFNQHNVVDECIRQTIAFLSANSNDRPFHTELPKYIWSDQEPVSLNAYLLNANNEQVNTPDAQLTITDSNGKKQNFSFERSGNAYKLNIGIWAGGTYSYTAHTNYNGKAYSASGSFVVQSMPIEMMETGADYPLLHGLAHKYNGSFVPAANINSLYDSISKNAQIKPVIQTNVETVPLVDRKWYFFLILLFAVAEWLLRKYWLAQ
jgi:hypothetical protein